MAESSEDLNAESQHNTLSSSTQDPENNEYGTPPDLWRPLSRAVDGFDLDPCSGAEPESIAEERFTKDDDGLAQSWFGDVFVNPPWSTNGDGTAKHRWLAKARSEARRDAVDSVTVIIPSDTSAQWFHEHVLAAPVVCFVGPGRIAFLGADRNPSFGLLIPVFGDDAARLVEPLSSKGAVLRGREFYDPAPQAQIGVVR